MVKLLTIVCTVLMSLSSHSATMAKAPEQMAGTTVLQSKSFYSNLTQLLEKHVKQGKVNYRDLQKDKPALDRLVKQIGEYNLNGAGKAERKAFFINAYNVLVLYQVLEHYPLKSVMDVPGFFDKQQYLVAGEQLTLNELEKKKLLLPYRDARIHFALVCAANSCPPLLNKAYTPQTIEEQLQAQAIKSLRDTQFIRVDEKDNKVDVSEIFRWYEKDFLAEAPSVRSYINLYRNHPVPKSMHITYYTYDWSLNDMRE